VLTNVGFASVAASQPRAPSAATFECLFRLFRHELTRQHPAGWGGRWQRWHTGTSYEGLRSKPHYMRGRFRSVFFHKPVLPGNHRTGHEDHGSRHHQLCARWSKCKAQRMRLLVTYATTSSRPTAAATSNAANLSSREDVGSELCILSRRDMSAERSRDLPSAERRHGRTMRVSRRQDYGFSDPRVQGTG